MSQIVQVNSDNILNQLLNGYYISLNAVDLDSTKTDVYTVTDQ